MDLVLLYMLVVLLVTEVFGKQDIFLENKNTIFHHSSFSCKNKLIGNYYADPDTNCQMFHVCVKVSGFGVQDFKFVCPIGLAFDQEAQICTDWGDVDCEYINLKYNTKFDLLKLSKKKSLTYEQKSDDDELLKESPSSNFYSHKNGLQKQTYRERIIPTTTTLTPIRDVQLKESPNFNFVSHKNVQKQNYRERVFQTSTTVGPRDESLNESSSFNFYSPRNKVQQQPYREPFTPTPTPTTVSNNLELLKEEPSSHFYSHRNDINTRYQMSSTVKAIVTDLKGGELIGNVFNRLSAVHTTVPPRLPTTPSKIPYETTTTVKTDILKQRFERITTIITPVNSANQKINRQRIVFSDINNHRKGEKTTTTAQPTIENRRYYVHINTSKSEPNLAVNDNAQNIILKPLYENKKIQIRKEPQENVNNTTERKYNSRKVNTKKELTPSSSTKWKYIDNFIPTTFKPAQNLFQSNRISINVNSTSPFINTNQISSKNKLRNKKVSQVKSKNRQSKDYDYNYYEDISENVSPEYDFIEFKKIK